MNAPRIDNMPDSYINPTAPQRDFGAFTFKFFTDIFSNLQISPDGGNSSVVSGKVAIITTGAAVALPSLPLQTGLSIKAGKGNANPIEIGGGANLSSLESSSGNGFPLYPGDTISFGLSNSGAVWINGTAGDYVSFAGN